MKSSGRITHVIDRVERFEIVGPYTLALRFEDGAHQRIDVLPVLEGEPFGPLQNPNVFNAVSLDNDVGTLRPLFRVVGDLCAGGGNRTRTPLARPRILSPVRLPVPPPRHVVELTTRSDSIGVRKHDATATPPSRHSAGPRVA